MEPLQSMRHRSASFWPDLHCIKILLACLATTVAVPGARTFLVQRYGTVFTHRCIRCRRLLWVTAMSGPAAVQSLESSPSQEGPSVDTWSDSDQRIVVSQPAAGFLYDLIMRAKLDAAPDDVYTVLKDPNSHLIFRGIKDTIGRHTLEDDGKGRRKLLVKHRALTKFLWISVTFDTELHVWEDDHERTIRFTNARSDGFMKKFDGLWQVQPFTQQTLDSVFKAQADVQQEHSRFSPAAALAGMQQRLSHSKQPHQQTLVTLEQALAPRVKPPGPVGHLVRGLCARVLQNMMADLRTEVYRRQELEDEEATSHHNSKFSRKHQVPSLPVASITAASSSSRLCGYSSNSSSHSYGSGWDRGVVSELQHGNCSSKGVLDAGAALINLLACAVPLEVTIKL